MGARFWSRYRIACSRSRSRLDWTGKWQLREDAPTLRRSRASAYTEGDVCVYVYIYIYLLVQSCTRTSTEYIHCGFQSGEQRPSVEGRRGAWRGKAKHTAIRRGLRYAKPEAVNIDEAQRATSDGENKIANHF